MPVKCIQITVNGKVQGVFFRHFTKEAADQLNISGMVKNSPDGSVYIEASGSLSAIEKFMLRCQSGPASALVTTIEVKEIPLQQFKGFEIKYF